MNSFPFSKNLFWDCEIPDIDLRKNRRYIIERVLTRGQWSDFNALLKMYNVNEIKSAIIKSKELDPKTAHFCSWYFNIPESEIHVSSFYR
jgi:hypothetical protein